MRKNPSTYIIAGLLIALCYLPSSCQKDVSADNGLPNTPNLQIRFNATVDGDDLIFGKIYSNAFAENYSVSAFKFYIHGIELINSQTSNIFRIDKTDHYLVNAGDSSVSSIQLPVSPSAYNRISFIIGVDSIRNVSGAQTGALDPAQGMFWTWSTGYIMAKLEGNSPVAATPNQVIEYHVGGFKGTESVLRKITLDFPPGQSADIKQGGQTVISISANINSWFNHTNPIRISQKPVSMTPGTLATQLADNYSNMFTVVEIVNE